MKRFFWGFCIFLCVSTLAYSEKLVDERIPPVGIIFNVGDILQGIDSYQGGIGIKYKRNEKISWRFLLDFYYDSAAYLTSVNTGIAYEKHFYDTRISPYIGGELKPGIIYYKPENSTNSETTIPLKLNGIFGVEIYLTEFLSLFAEYSLGAQYTFTNPEVGSNNSRLIIESGLGNSGKIGVTVYFRNVIQLSD